MKRKEIITQFNNTKDFFNRYYFLLNFKKNRYYTKNEVDKLSKGRFYQLGDNCYVKLPHITRNIWRVICGCLAALLVAGIATPVSIFYMPHKVTLNSKYLDLVGDTTCRLANDYKCSLKIKDEYLPTKYMEDMNIFEVKVNGNAIPPEDFYFTYQTNAKNELVINKKHLGGNIEITADLNGRQASHRCFFFGYADFTIEPEDVIYPKNVGRKEVVLPGSGTDNMYLKEGYDMAITQKGDEPTKFNYNAIIVREDNAFAIKLHRLKDYPLPEDLWFRCNARYTKKGVDFTIDFNEDRSEAILKVNYFIVRDSGSIVPYEE